ncbi:2'-5' RNA ligase family protein [uncultured Pseudokineococcus sp.]|uniref:2'-5' RNA ligase family protein n=1 Tax=uncultured Pseudokineococcus sp. TaxID=1642928 RepID=UPI002631C418|nr:2'-5' RNA ligase family protein [uncultured Pseudokineococcus sp.]
MVQTVEALLDAETERLVVGQWQVLQHAGLPSQADHTGATNRPHVTLATAAQMPAALDDALREAAEPLPQAVRLGPLVVLGGRRHVLARLLVATPGLLALHARTAEVVSGCPEPGELLAPGAWTPHVTLARGLTGEQLAEALAALGGAGALGPAADVEAAVVGVRRFDGDARAVRLVAGRDDLRPGGPAPR